MAVPPAVEEAGERRPADAQAAPLERCQLEDGGTTEDDRLR
jgi:hypothetical protein